MVWVMLRTPNTSYMIISVTYVTATLLVLVTPNAKFIGIDRFCLEEVT